MTLQTAGIHHITAFVGDAQRNADFYAGILGLRLVKRQLTLTPPRFTTSISGMSRVHRAPLLPSFLGRQGAKAGLAAGRLA